MAVFLIKLCKLFQTITFYLLLNLTSLPTAFLYFENFDGITKLLCSGNLLAHLKENGLNVMYSFIHKCTASCFPDIVNI